ncbi:MULTISPECIES: IS256 family transposase [unclassified Synechococcus]|uniref:IS256 family transposase n=1 Tax=unclassified Synechococcus TaxID=2626047 RepID=UPI000069846E|nr:MULTISPECIES: IS256 family transposase [unclassified Synechococcus]EAQ75615.1 putative transposase [Synechococcus sp. WH 5701]WFN59704.1 IS256 family transposase [Synechococcus sp. CCFWC 502]CAK6697031.1 IS256 family transposase IS1245 [Synechococcus sp. CBW1107]
MPKRDSDASALASLLDGSKAGELIPELARHGLQQLIELEAAAVLGADLHERSEERLGYRNGYRSRSLTTQVGDIDLLIPKLRAGSFLPSILEPRRRVDQALYAVIMEAYIGGVSTRKLDALVGALGSQSGISKSQVSRICQEIDQQVQAFLSRPLQESGYAYVYLDATYLKGRLGKALQVCSRAVVVAMGVNVDGRRELLGLKVGDSETEGFWSEFLASLIAAGFCEAVERGLTGVKLVISDAHVGLTKAIRRQLQGCVWQRCRVHFARNLLQRVPIGAAFSAGVAHQGMVTAALRSVFAQENAGEILSRWDDLAASLIERFPKAAELMHEAREDVLAFRHFPQQHWRKVWSTNLLERVNEEIKRRTRVVGIFPNDAAITRLVGAVLLEQHEHWQLEGRRMFSAESMAAITDLEALPALQTSST